MVFKCLVVVLVLLASWLSDFSIFLIRHVVEINYCVAVEIFCNAYKLEKE